MTIVRVLSQDKGCAATDNNNLSSTYLLSTYIFFYRFQLLLREEWIESVFLSNS